ncbi:hypothetical protein [Hydrogenimonas urashimensis]|uniref:hypothetical protein n=1 Tax=Hydrogenimonas urashimensis TaxID=2740515 RepID=UPI0019163BE7|nr:hypothetical protein [Hydrogenimonas urashimensis]
MVAETIFQAIGCRAHVAPALFYKTDAALEETRRGRLMLFPLFAASLGLFRHVLVEAPQSEKKSSPVLSTWILEMVFLFYLNLYKKVLCTP